MQTNYQKNYKISSLKLKCQKKIQKIQKRYQQQKKLQEKMKILQKKLVKNQLGIQATHQEIVAIRQKIKEIIIDNH
ncbi:unnamed protein product [Mucor circinelloides]